MAKLIQRLKIWKELRRLENRLREDPSPSTFVDLGQVHINLGMAERAHDVAKEGLALFPDAAELIKLRDFSHRAVVRARTKSLRDKLNRSPTSKLYRELAYLFLELGDHGAVHATCEEWSVRFRSDPGPWLVQGQARLGNYYRDLSAREGDEAIRCLERAVALDSRERKARRLLAELFHRIGAMHRARAQLDALRVDGEDPELRVLREQVTCSDSLGNECGELLRRVEAEGALPYAPPTSSVPTDRLDENMSSIRESLAHVAEMQGVQKATYIKGTRALVKGDIRDGKDSFLRIVRVVAKAGHRFSRRLDIGSFKKGVLEGPFGHICICCYGEVLAAVQCDESAPIDSVLAELQEIVAGSLYAMGVSL